MITHTQFEKSDRINMLRPMGGKETGILSYNNRKQLKVHLKVQLKSHNFTEL